MCSALDRLEKKGTCLTLPTADTSSLHGCQCSQPCKTEYILLPGYWDAEYSGPELVDVLEKLNNRVVKSDGETVCLLSLEGHRPRSSTVHISLTPVTMVYSFNGRQGQAQISCSEGHTAWGLPSWLLPGSASHFTTRESLCVIRQWSVCLNQHHDRHLRIHFAVKCVPTHGVRLLFCGCSFAHLELHPVWKEPAHILLTKCCHRWEDSFFELPSAEMQNKI